MLDPASQGDDIFAIGHAVSLLSAEHALDEQIDPGLGGADGEPSRANEPGVFSIDQVGGMLNTHLTREGASIDR